MASKNKYENEHLHLLRNICIVHINDNVLESSDSEWRWNCWKRASSIHNPSIHFLPEMDHQLLYPSASLICNNWMLSKGAVEYARFGSKF